MNRTQKRKICCTIHYVVGLSLSQVDDLKSKLASQEVELAQKNEAANKLIQVVGAETEKVPDYPNTFKNHSIHPRALFTRDICQGSHLD